MAKKLTLDVDDLAVESFHSADTPAQRGTVHGNDVTTFDCEPTTDRYDRNCASAILGCLPTGPVRCNSSSLEICAC